MLKNSFENIQPNKEICEFIGAFIGDGYIGNYGKRKNQFLIGISGDQKLDEDYLKNYLRPLIIRNFPFTKPKLYYRKDENTLMLRIYCKKLYNLFLRFGFTKGRKSNSIKIPEQILKNEELMNATIRGIFDTDGCIFLDRRKVYKKPYPRITLQLSSIDLIEQLEEYLSKDFKLYVNKSNRDGYRNYIEIYGHEQLERFLKKIGFSNKRHLNKVV
ncbi:MAG: LAGLIDADG family homing endonuclease [Patescibacteria group bacterium]